jgi:putative transposase
MARPPRNIQAGTCYHVFNRGNGRARLFHKPADYDAFVAILAEGLKRYDITLLAWCLMPNHWHLVLVPRRAEHLAGFIRWISITHVRRRHEYVGAQQEKDGVAQAAPTGHIYQGRYKCFPAERDETHFLSLCRYVENNARRARLVKRAEDWAWSSVSQREHKLGAPALGEWPVDRPSDWLDVVNAVIPPETLHELRQSITRDRPFGSAAWVKNTARRLGLEQTLHPRGRPRKPISQLCARQRRRRAKESGQKEK